MLAIHDYIHGYTLTQLYKLYTLRLHSMNQDMSALTLDDIGITLQTSWERQEG